MGPRFIGLFILFAICVAAHADEQPDAEAVRDFIAANDLTVTSVIRRDRSLSYKSVNDNFIVAVTRRKHYLFEFKRRCRDLNEDLGRRPELDFRSSKNIIRAKEDTYRGCRIDTIYEVTEAQVDELSALGDAPGDGIYLNSSDSDDSVEPEQPEAKDEATPGSREQDH